MYNSLGSLRRVEMIRSSLLSGPPLDFHCTFDDKWIFPQTCTRPQTNALCFLSTDLRTTR